MARRGGHDCVAYLASGRTRSLVGVPLPVAAACAAPELREVAAMGCYQFPLA